LVVGLAMVAMLVCGVALAVVPPDPAAEDDAVARRVVKMQASEVKARFALVRSCASAGDAPCLARAASQLYSTALRGRANLVALRALPLSLRVRSGVDLCIRGLGLQARFGYGLYRAAASRSVLLTNRALAGIQTAFVATDQAVALVHP
jgi:hypothetical protein